MDLPSLKIVPSMIFLYQLIPNYPTMHLIISFPFATLAISLTGERLSVSLLAYIAEMHTVSFSFIYIGWIDMPHLWTA